MKNYALAILALSFPVLPGPTAPAKAPETMTKIVVRLMGPGVKAGSFSALPKTICRGGEHYARIEDPPDAKQKMQKLTIIDEPDAYSINLIDRKGTHVIDQGGPNNLHLPIVLPFDPKHKLGKLDRIEFGAEYEFFKQAGARKLAGPPVNSKPTDVYELKTLLGTANLTVRGGTEVPVYLSWQTSDGIYKYEYITYEEIPFDANLFSKPSGIEWREIPPDPDASRGDR
jgi:hypothetical protein